MRWEGKKGWKGGEVYVGEGDSVIQTEKMVG